MEHDAAHSINNKFDLDSGAHAIHCAKFAIMKVDRAIIALLSHIS